MAEELLAVYEQLGVVFEVTRHLPRMRTAGEVLELFVSSLQQSFGTCRVSLIDTSDESVWLVRGCVIPRGPWLTRRLALAQSSGGACVDVPPEEANLGDVAEIMFAPVQCGDQMHTTIVMTRGSEDPEFRASDMSVVESLARFCGDLIRNHRLLREVRELSVRMVRSLVSAVDQKDPYTSGHSVRVAYYATMLGTALNLRRRDIQMLQWSALLHDVGKIGIRDEVLKKEGKLTEAEFEHIKEHPVRSYEVVKEVPQLSGALPGVLHHHERFDGSGYPSGLKGKDIPRQALMIQLADVFDALTSTRSYRPAFDWNTALSVMEREAGKVSDLELWRVFHPMMRSRLEADETAWNRMVHEANRFIQEWDGCEDELDD